MSDAMLIAEGLCRSYGGVAAVKNVSLSCALGEIHALIGPNGAGKTTLLNLISGQVAADSGKILYRGRQIRGLAPHRIARLGIGRSYQRTKVFHRFSAFENCRLAAQAQLPHSMHFFRNASAWTALNEAAMDALSSAGLANRADVLAAALSHGEQRQLDIALTLATKPRVLLLDEPLAGMGSAESARMVEFLRSLRPAHAVLLVEHDMDAVFSLADRLTVMVDGEVIASGLPEQVRDNAAVQSAYLGGSSDGDA